MLLSIGFINLESKVYIYTNQTWSSFNCQMTFKLSTKPGSSIVMFEVILIETQIEPVSRLKGFFHKDCIHFVISLSIFKHFVGLLFFFLITISCLLIMINWCYLCCPWSVDDQDDNNDGFDWLWSSWSWSWCKKNGNHLDQHQWSLNNWHNVKWKIHCDPV